MAIENLVVISDLHCGSNFAICPPQDKIQITDEVSIPPNNIQEELIKYWLEFWEWVDTKTGGTFDLCINGDWVDGNKHISYARMTDSSTYQGKMAVDLIRPLKYKKLYAIYGTHAHDGLSGSRVTGIANALKAELTPDSQKRASHTRMFRFPNRALVDIKHHGRISKPSNKPNLLYGEWVDCCVNKALLHMDVPDMAVRSHGHEFKACGVPAKLVRDVSIMLPAWQCLTPWAKAAPLSSRNAVVNIGGVILTVEDGRVLVKEKWWSIDEEKETVL